MYKVQSTQSSYDLIHRAALKNKYQHVYKACRSGWDPTLAYYMFNYVKEIKRTLTVKKSTIIST
jgi:hypothetical protein